MLEFVPCFLSFKELYETCIKIYNLKRGSALLSFQRNIHNKQVQGLSILRYGNNEIATMTSYIIILTSFIQMPDVISMNIIMGPPNMPNIDVRLELVLKLKYDALNITITQWF
jgi:hypothetical protein